MKYHASRVTRAPRSGIGWGDGRPEDLTLSAESHERLTPEGVRALRKHPIGVFALGFGRPFQGLEHGDESRRGHHAECCPARPARHRSAGARTCRCPEVTLPGPSPNAVKL